MYKNFCIITFFLLIALFVNPVSIFAKSTFESREQILDFLQKAFQAQVELSEKERSLKEIEAILSPFFSESYQKVFLQENLFDINGKYITYGSDFAPYYIPFFQFSERTKVASLHDKIYVFEYFPGNVEGPVSYESHFEGILIERVADSFKVSEYLYDNIPNEIVNQKQNEASRKIIKSSVSLLNPYFSFRKEIENSKWDLSISFPFMVLNNQNTIYPHPKKRNVVYYD
jgi:hypothetical protein